MVKWIGVTAAAVVVAGLGGAYVSGSQFESQYLAVIEKGQFGDDIAITSKQFEKHFFSSDVVTELSYTQSEQGMEAGQIQIVATSKVLHLPWGLSIHSGLTFSADNMSSEQVAQEFGTSELIQATTVINPISGVKVNLSSISISDDKGKFSPIEFEVSPVLDEQSQLTGLDYSWTWDGGKLNTDNLNKQLEVSGVTGQGKLSLDDHYQLWLGSNSMSMEQFTFREYSTHAIIDKLKVTTEFGIDNEIYQANLKLNAQGSNISQMGIEFDLKDLSIDLLFDGLNAKALAALNGLPDQDLNKPEVKAAANELLSHGGSFALQDLSFNLDGGQADANVKIVLESGLTMDTITRAQTADEFFAMLAVDGLAEFDRSLVQESSLSMGLMMLKQQGYLSLPSDGDKASMSIKMTEGSLLLNDKYVPL